MRKNSHFSDALCFILSQNPSNARSTGILTSSRHLASISRLRFTQMSSAASALATRVTFPTSTSVTTDSDHTRWPSFDNIHRLFANLMRLSQMSSETFTISEKLDGSCIGFEFDLAGLLRIHSRNKVIWDRINPPDDLPPLKRRCGTITATFECLEDEICKLHNFAQSAIVDPASTVVIYGEWMDSLGRPKTADEATSRVIAGLKSVNSYHPFGYAVKFPHREPVFRCLDVALHCNFVAAGLSPPRLLVRHASTLAEQLAAVHDFVKNPPSSRVEGVMFSNGRVNFKWKCASFEEQPVMPQPARDLSAEWEPSVALLRDVFPVERILAPSTVLTIPPSAIPTAFHQIMSGYAISSEAIKRLPRDEKNRHREAIIELVVNDALSQFEMQTVELRALLLTDAKKVVPTLLFK